MLAWEIGKRNRRSLWLVSALLAFGAAASGLVPGTVRNAGVVHNVLATLNGVLMVVSLLLVFGIFNYTSTNPGNEWTGFPYRLFVLPAPTWLLVALPMVLGVAGIALVYGAWATLVFSHREIPQRWWFALVLGVYMMLYQSVLWCLAGLRLTRIVALGLAGPLFVGLGVLPFFRQYIPSIWFSQGFWAVVLVGLGTVAFGAAYVAVARQRCGGGRRRSWLRALWEDAMDRLPVRHHDFASPAAAQLWFEWRRNGLLLPGCIGALLLLVIGPLSWAYRHDPESTAWVLAWTLVLPLLLALPIGKGWSRPDFWSGRLSLPPFVAVRPITAGEWVVVRLKVAALSAGLAWLVVGGFLAIWLSLWGDVSALTMPRIGFWMVYGHSVYPQYAIGALLILAGALMTWRFLVSGLWTGLSGSARLFIGSTALFATFGLVAGIGTAIVLTKGTALRHYLRYHPDVPLAVAEGLVACAVIAKFWLAAFAWRRIAPGRVQRYLWLWTGATLLMLALAVLLWAHGTSALLLTSLGLPPFDVYRLQGLFLLLALLSVPIARLGLAPGALARNRWGGGG